MGGEGQRGLGGCRGEKFQQIGWWFPESALSDQPRSLGSVIRSLLVLPQRDVTVKWCGQELDIKAR